MRIPDGISPVVGVRLWKVIVDEDIPWLRSTSANMFWEPGLDVHATCWQGEESLEILQKPPTEHRAAPNKQCWCGVWALDNREDLRDYIASDSDYVAGVVQLWGKVVVGTRGWRGEYARPIRLFSRKPLPPWKQTPGSVKRWKELLEETSRRYELPIVEDYPIWSCRPTKASR